MPGLSLYDVSIPSFTAGLQTLLHITKRATAEHQGAAGFLRVRIYQDMRDFTYQVQQSCFWVRATIAELTGDGTAPTAVDPNDEKTSEQLVAVIEETLALLAGITPEVLGEGKEHARLEKVLGPGFVLKVNGHELVQFLAMPNFFFHITTAYDILRSEGVGLGKADYISTFVGKIKPFP